eukprot:818058-Pyramimonas_sp.AAC.1
MCFSFSTEKLLTPIVLASPLDSNPSIAVHISSRVECSTVGQCSKHRSKYSTPNSLQCNHKAVGSGAQVYASLVTTRDVCLLIYVGWATKTAWTAPV